MGDQLEIFDEIDRQMEMGDYVPPPDPNAWRTGEEEVRLDPEGIDTKINLCDTCVRRLEYPMCCSPDVAFGDGKGNDNIIKCKNYQEDRTPILNVTVKGGEEVIVDDSQQLGDGLAAAAQAAGAEIKVVTVDKLAGFRPGEDLEVRGHYAEAVTLLQYAEDRVIDTMDDNKAANDDLSIITKIRKAMDAKKKDYLGPLKQESDAIRDTYNYLMGPVLEADKITRGKMADWNAKQKRIRAEQEEINRLRMEAARKEAELSGTGELTESVNLVEVIPESTGKVSTELGTSGMTSHWTYEVVDFALVPDAYKVIDSPQLTTIARSHHDKKPIPGVRFYDEPSITMRTK